MKKICMVAYTYYEWDPRVRREAEALVKAGCLVTVIALRAKHHLKKEKIMGVDVHRMPLSKKRGRKASYLFGYLFFLFLAFVYVSIFHLRVSYKLIYIHNMPNFLVFSALLPKIMGVPVILDVHDPMPELFGSIFTKSKKSLLYKLLLIEEKISFRFSNQLITVHKGMFDLLTSRGGHPCNIEIIHNYPDPALFDKLSNLARNDNEFILVYAGTVSPRHRLSLFVDALYMLEGEMPDLRLKIVGDGPDLDELINLAKKLKLEKRIDFLGFVPVDKLPGILTKCDVSIASYADDSFGNLVFPTKVFEGLMVGLPVLCTKIDLVLSYLSEDSVFYFNPDDPVSLVEQIRLIKNNEELVKKKIKNGKDFVSKNNWDIEKQKFVKIVSNLV